MTGKNNFENIKREIQVQPSSEKIIFKILKEKQAKRTVQ